MFYRRDLNIYGFWYQDILKPTSCRNQGTLYFTGTFIFRTLSVPKSVQADYTHKTTFKTLMTSQTTAEQN
jgi:hypothetical protein